MNVLKKKCYIFFFVFPAFFLFVCFGLLPIVFNVYISLFKTDLMSPPQFVGIKNYMNLMKDQVFITAVKNNILLVIGSLLAHMPLALLLSHILFRSKRLGSCCGNMSGIIWSFN